jgi:two-component system sensor histidine kinase CpxA
MKLFLRIFLSFWVATILMIVAVLTASNMLPIITSQEKNSRFDPDVATEHLTQAINLYETRGSTAFLDDLRSPATINHGSLFLMDEKGKVLIRDGRQFAPDAEMARDALDSGHSELIRLGFRTAFACPIRSATGRRYAVVMTVTGKHIRILNPRLWYDLTIAMLCTLVVCVALSLYLTRPITRLRKTAQRLAGGDLSARASPPRMMRRDELGDLARDFDVMATQIQLLMTAQRRFVADVSHELGAPLTRMHLALALLRRRFGNNDAAELDRIERETDKLSNLVQQLLLLAGLEAGSWPAETLSAVSMKSFCDDILEDARFEAQHSRCQLTGAREDVRILVYPGLLRRAVDNVLRNAIRYAPAGSVISLNCKADTDTQEVRLEIRDHGPGVPESMLSDIFRPFFRTSPGRESNSGGTGLGLAIASEAVRLHDGAITARNHKDGGLLVTITLPMRTVLEDEPPMTPSKMNVTS